MTIGHGAYPQIEDDPDRPATLSWRLATDLLRNAIGFDGCAVSVNEDANVRARFEEAKREREVVVPETDRRHNPRTPGKGRTGREEWT